MFHVKHSESFSQILDRVAHQAGIVLSEKTLSQLEQHWDMVKTWNARTNLTSILDDEQSALLHYRDSLEALPFLDGGPIVDFGSGAGYPGLVLACARPDIEFSLVEPRRKRASFLQIAAARLQLKNVVIVHGSSNDRPTKEFSQGVTRATFSSEADIQDCLRWLRPGGLLIAYRAAADIGPQSQRVHQYQVNGINRALEFWARLE